MIVGSQGFRPNREGEALSRRAKRWIDWDPGIRKAVKRKFSKQVRKAARHEALIEASQGGA